MDTISLDLHGLRHAITIMPHSRAREDTAQPSRLHISRAARDYPQKLHEKMAKWRDAGKRIIDDDGREILPDDPQWIANIMEGHKIVRDS